MLLCIDKFGSEYHATCDSFSLVCPVSDLRNFAKNVALNCRGMGSITLWFDDKEEVITGEESVSTMIYLHYSLGI